MEAAPEETTSPDPLRRHASFPVLVSTMMGALFGLIVIHGTAGVVIQWNGSRSLFEILSAAYGADQGGLVVYHTAMGATLGMASGFLLAGFYRRQLAHEVERRRMERRLAETARFDGLGRMASGIAHDFNNHISSTLTDLYLADRFADDPTKVRHYVARMQRVIEAARELPRELLAFARGTRIESRPCDLGEEIEAFRSILLGLVGPGIQVDIDAGHGLSVVVDPTQLRQAVMNLVANARDAMPEGGRIQVRARRAEMRHPTDLADEDRGLAIVEVIDTGHGMDDTVVARLFEPFFTTKEEGKGTGLGLVTALAFAKGAGGTITVRSKVGEGTTFVIWLPLTHGHGVPFPPS